MESYGMTIAGRTVQTSDRDDVVNPAKGEPFATCPRGSKAHVDEAVAAAADAYRTWKRDESARRAVLGACATAIQGRAQEIATLLSQEQGKPLTAAMAETFGAAMWFQYYADLKVEPEVLQDDGEKIVKVVRKPLGVVAAITPWNFPVILLAWKLAPAWLAGNTVVAKPSPYTPLSSLLVADVLKDVVPPGVLNVLSGGNDLGAALATHPTVRKISFTGSVGTGKKIMGYAVEDLKRVTLELGGNDPAIVLDDVDPAAVADSLFWGAFANSGQVCTAIKRLYVHEKVYEPILAALVERARSVKVGDGLDPESQLGPINNKMQLERVVGLVDDAKKAGGRIEAGGARPAGSGYFFPPTIVSNVGPGVRLVDEEQFGTALPILKYSKVEDAIDQANRTHFGLGGSVWSGSVERGMELVQELESGSGWVNQHMDVTPFAPFGGSKWSGIGYENGRWGFEAFTELQVVNAKR